MKKIYIALAAILALSAAASAEVGIGLKAGMFQQDNNLEQTFAFGPSKISDDNFFGGVEFIFQDYFAANSMIGFKIGGEMRAPLKIQNTLIVTDELKNDTFTFPLTLYYKFAPPCTIFEFWIGGGVTAAYSRWSYNPNSPVMPERTTNNLSVFPHVKAGIELRVADHIGIVFDGGYNFSAKVKEDFVGGWGAERDFSGFEGNVALRFYF